MIWYLPLIVNISGGKQYFLGLSKAKSKRTSIISANGSLAMDIYGKGNPPFSDGVFDHFKSLKLLDMGKGYIDVLNHPGHHLAGVGTPKAADLCQKIG